MNPQSFVDFVVVGLFGLIILQGLTIVALWSIRLKLEGMYGLANKDRKRDY